ncbi:trypsin-like serine peptidase [Spongiactinospora sp. 9N601]|uniref:trypsin-like serine peptidase n=1 Tax=Spongiactinospora sp. 9N601 TaxID=3375149 RepID=UPI0037ADFE0A
MKRILLPAGGAILATGLLAAGLASASTANAAPKKASDNMASATQAYSVAKFWLDANGATLKAAQQYKWDSNAAPKLTIGGSAGDDGKAGLVPPTGYKKVTPQIVKNINLPKTVGKVFFQTSGGGLAWCSATSIDAKYRNLVATAGHCVYDTATNGDVLDKWVFVPGYHQGKATWGVYVGKTAHTHYDFANFEDFDRDYAFVTVYDGISLAGQKEVTKEEYDKWSGDKWTDKKEITKEEYKKCKLNLGECWAEGKNTADDVVGPDYPGAVLTKKEVTEAEYKAAKVGKGNGNKLGEPVVESVTETEYKAYNGPGKKETDGKGNYTITHYYVQQWVKPGTAKKYYTAVYFIGGVVNRGRLGDNVGGQGFAWNQKPGQPVFVFGYPAGPHPDGDKPYTGVTQKWCYSKKPSGKVYQAPAFKAEEHIWIKCAMTPGVSGGPWLIKYSNSKRIGYVNGVASLVSDQDKNGRYDTLTSPYFDGETQQIYAYAANQWSGKIVGPNGEALK